MPEKLKEKASEHAGQMVTCAHCGMKAPKEKMIAHGQQHFCCHACFDADQKK